MCPPPSAGATRLWEPAPPRQPTSISPPASPDTTTIPDCVPKDAISQGAYIYAQQNLHPLILAHSLRVYLLARGLGTRESSSYVQDSKLHLLFTACIMHDIGTTDAHNGSQRFEVEGADAAKTLLSYYPSSDTNSAAVFQAKVQAHEVWTAIALHTSPGIAERISPLSRLVRLAVAMDFKRPAALRLTSGEEMERVEALFPRGDIEKVLGDAVVEQVLGRDGEGEEAAGVKAPAASWPGVLAASARENVGWEGVNKAF